MKQNLKIAALARAETLVRAASNMIAQARHESSFTTIPDELRDSLSDVCDTLQRYEDELRAQLHKIIW